MGQPDFLDGEKKKKKKPEKKGIFGFTLPSGTITGGRRLEQL
jgi:hypothetical protein